MPMYECNVNLLSTQFYPKMSTTRLSVYGNAYAQNR